MNRNPSHNRTRTLGSLGICVLALIGAAILGVDDNPPGLAFTYLAAISFVIAFAHSWRSIRQFGVLVLVSVLGFVIFALLHNLLEGSASNLTGSSWLKPVLEGASVVAFLIAVLITPAAVAVGLIGAAILLVRKQFSKKT